VKDIRHRLTLLGTATSLALAAAVVTAAPAEARRNVGGSEPDASICVLPGKAELGSTGSGLGAICVCVLTPGGGVVRNVGTDPNAQCPPGVKRP
jgi:hypothetical protein